MWVDNVFERNEVLSVGRTSSVVLQVLERVSISREEGKVVGDPTAISFDVEVGDRIGKLGGFAFVFVPSVECGVMERERS